MADINDKYVLYYAVRGYASGETVTINIYDTAGTKEIDSGTMTELVSNLGIYYYNWYPRKRTTYTAVMDCAAKPRQVHEIIRIEKTKLAGAITFPKVRFPPPVFREDDKKKLFSKLEKIPIRRDRTNEVLVELREFKVLLKGELALLKSDVSDNKKHSALLFEKTKDTTKQTYNFYSSQLKKHFDDFKSKFSLEKKLSQMHDTLQTNLAAFNQVFDEATSNIALFNKVFDSDYIQKAETLKSHLDEVALLLKNANPNPESGDGPPEE